MNLLKILGIYLLKNINEWLNQIFKYDVGENIASQVSALLFINSISLYSFVFDSQSRDYAGFHPHISIFTSLMIWNYNGFQHSQASWEIVLHL